MTSMPSLTMRFRMCAQHRICSHFPLKSILVAPSLVSINPIMLSLVLQLSRVTVDTLRSISQLWRHLCNASQIASAVWGHGTYINLHITKHSSVVKFIIYRKYKSEQQATIHEKKDNHLKMQLLSIHESSIKCPVTAM